MVAFTGHFDGKVIVPDEPLSLPPNQRLVVHVTPEQAPLRGVEGKSLLSFAGTIPADDLDEMAKAIAAGCEQVDENGW